DGGPGRQGARRVSHARDDRIMVPAGGPPLFPYTTLFRSASARAVAERLGRTRWQVAYQSRSGSPHEPWLEPDVNDALRALAAARSEEHTSELQSPYALVCRLLLEKKKRTT